MEYRINPAAVTQSILALTVAISITESVRDCIAASGLKTPFYVASLRVFMTILIIICAILVIKYYDYFIQHPVQNNQYRS